LGAVVSALSPNTSLKKAFSFVIGNQIKWQTGKEKTATWEVKRDYSLHTYLECTASGSKAYYKLDDLMLHFTHFEGNRSTLLYQFYLAAFKVSFGFTHGLQLQDVYPVHMIFHPRKLIIQDFVAPFFRYLKGDYTLIYPQTNKGISFKPIELDGKIRKSRMGTVLETMEFKFLIEGQGIREFSFKTTNKQTKAICIQN
jgi:hypothetical protein